VPEPKRIGCGIRNVRGHQEDKILIPLIADILHEEPLIWGFFFV
jgi:hypothetical protein